ncbi:uncharacterized protein LOC5576591 [Aedes aegypti]|uniref:MSP domain-containing protein n=1 Tax=Aedes aegypti TaxID=7159 RepID=A0A903VBG1_AEDAE|nr:uncharacterized protein LOC5576591 [Aedes aegypti]
MRLTNPTEHVILFKIKTTAPKKYCVRPNCGVLEPKTTIEIAIILQPFIFDAAEKNKHKFHGAVDDHAGRRRSAPNSYGRMSARMTLWTLNCGVYSSCRPRQIRPHRGAPITATSTTTSQSANATPNKNESGVPVADTQYGGSGVSNEEDKTD